VGFSDITDLSILCSSSRVHIRFAYVEGRAFRHGDLVRVSLQ
jgi:hypothetical protein